MSAKHQADIVRVQLTVKVFMNWVTLYLKRIIISSNIDMLEMLDSHLPLHINF